MPFPPAFIDEVIARNPIEDVVGQYVTLKRSGSNLFWPVSLPRREDRLLLRRAGQRHVLLLRLPQGRRCHQFRDGN